MTYRIRFTPAAQKQILCLDKPAALRIRAYVEGLNLENPRLVGTPLSGGERLMALPGGGLPDAGENSR
jgi:mRNA-degrading endonuclease RelE of RelBE toxin-antitoxin system